MEAMTHYEPLPEADIEAVIPKSLPTHWKRLQWPIPAFDCHGVGHLRGIRIMMDAGEEEDGSRWIHVSVSRAGRIPSWEDMDSVKRLFLGPDRVAYQVHPMADEHYTLDGDRNQRLGTCLHLWSPLDNAPRLPNFLRARGGVI